MVPVGISSYIQYQKDQIYGLQKRREEKSHIKGRENISKRTATNLPGDRKTDTGGSQCTKQIDHVMVEISIIQSKD